MKPIILDHFRRWWWVWVLGGGLYGVLAVVTAHVSPDGQPRPQVAFPVGAFLGAFLVAMDVQRGHTRSLLALPLRPVQIARAWWWVAVGLPAAILAVILCIAFGVAFLIGPTPPVLFPVVMDWLDNSLLLGVLFFALTGLPARGYGSGDWKQQARGISFGAMWGGCVGGWMFFRYLDILTPLGAGIFLAGAVLTGLGWYRAEMLVMERAGLCPRSSSAGTAAALSRCAEGGGGLWFLAQTIFTRMVFFGLLMFTVGFIIFVCIAHAQSASPRDFLSGSTISLFTFQFMWMMSIQIFMFALNIRHLRIMPVSTTTLTSVLIFVPLAAMAVVYGASILLRVVCFQTPVPGLGELIREGCLLQISSATITVPLLIWRGIDLINYLIGMAIMLGGIFATIFFTGRMPMTVNVAVPPLILVVVFFATKLLLERGNQTYRPRTNQFMGLNWSGR